MTLNPGKCNFICLLSNLSVNEIFVYKNFKQKNTSVNEIFGVIIDKDREFDKHYFQKNTLFKSFIKDQFNYCPLLWMFCSHSSNNLINKIHKRALSSTSEINDISCNELFSINNEVSIHNNKKYLYHRLKC